MTNTGGTPAGWYHAPGDPDGTQRYWDGAQWLGEPQAVQQTPQPPAGASTPPPPAASSTDAPPQQFDAPSGGQPPQFGAPSGGDHQPPAFGAPGSQQPPVYGSPPSGGGAPPGYTEFGGPGSAPQTDNLAEGWQRLVARLIDAIIIGVVSFIIGLIIAIALDNAFGGFLAGLIGVAIGTAYEVLVTTNLGATLGKKIFNMRIVNEADGSKVDEQVMLRRYSPSILIGVIGAVPILGLLSIPLGLAFFILSIVWIFTDDKRRSVYDKVGKTIVIAD